MPDALSLVPPLVAILLAILTRRVIPSLLIAVVIGAAMLLDPSGLPILRPFVLVWDVGVRLWSSATEPEHLMVLGFTLLIGAMVGVMHAEGGLQALIARVAGRAAGHRGGQVLTWLLGLGLFFDDYANTLLLGNTMRPLADRWGISRAKLAYLVDSTAAPVAGLSVVSTWVAFELSVIAEGLAALPGGSEASPMGVFVASIPLRFYPLLALAMVGLVAWTGRDFGPMWKAERSAAEARRRQDGNGEPEGPRVVGGDPWAVAPLVICLGAILVTLSLTGPERDDSRWIVRAFWRVLEGDAYLALIAGGAVGLVAALLRGRTKAGLGAGRLLAAGLGGAWQVFPAMVILWLAWAISAMTEPDQLDTQGFLARVVQANIAGWALPTVIFLVAGATAFATGTSWATMGLLTPLAIPVAAATAGTVDPFDSAVLAAVAAVLAGAIWGDHCSPISDTTVLSSRASGCDHIEHVRTQLPYAGLAGGIAILCGTLPVGFGASAWITLPASITVLVLCVWALGKPVEGG